MNAAISPAWDSKSPRTASASDASVEARLWTLRKKVYRQPPRKQRVHAVDGVADGHRVPSVAVISAAGGREFCFLRVALRPPKLESHFHCDLNRNRTRIAEEHAPKPRHVGERCGKLHRSPVRKPAEHHMAHFRNLRPYRRVDFRVAVSVGDSPPRRHSVYDFPPVGKREFRALRRFHHIGARGILCARVGVPDAAGIEGDDFVNIHSRACRAS